MSLRLFTRSALNALTANPGFEFGSNFLIRIDQRSSDASEVEALSLIREAESRIASLPGVESVSVASLVPMGPARSSRPFAAGAATPAPDTQTRYATYNQVGTEYFHTLGVPLLRGREFNRMEVEGTNAPPSVIINQKLADQLWPQMDPIGQSLQIGSGQAQWRGATVVGVTQDVAWNIFDRDRPAGIYEPAAGHFLGKWNLHVRIRPGVQADGIMAACAQELRAFDARIPTPQIQSLKSVQRLNPQILLMEAGGVLFGIFGMVAEFLSFVGIYGLKAYEVTRRTAEIGIRMALGAQPGDVLNLILRESLRLAGWGLAIGFLLSLGMGSLARSFLYQAPKFDLLIFATVPLLVLTVVLAACSIPTRRVARIDPMQALRSE